MTRVIIMLLCAFISTSTPQQQQTFAGEWVLVPAGPGAAGPAPFGAKFSATQTAEQLSLKFVVTVAARGGAEDRNFNLTFSFNGAPCNVERRVASTGGGRTSSFDTASWEGSGLVVKRYVSYPNQPETLSRRFVIKASSDKTLSVEVTSYEGGRVVGTTVSAYQRQGTASVGASLVEIRTNPAMWRGL